LGLGVSVLDMDLTDLRFWNDVLLERGGEDQS